MANAQNNGAVPKVVTRRVTLPLLIGILLMPVIFSLLLLREGYSAQARALGLSWAGLVLIASLIRTASDLPPAVPEPTSDAEIASQSGGSRNDGTTKEKVAENAPALPAPKATIAATPAPPPVPTMDPERRRGMHCLNNWDGSHWGMQNEIKRRLRDPDSFEHIETRIAPIDEVGNHAIFMSFRARNGFGGMNVQQAIGAVDHAQCKLLIMHM